MNSCPHELLPSWTPTLMSSYPHELLSSWAPALMSSCPHELLPSWAPALMSSCPHELLPSCMSSCPHELLPSWAPRPHTPKWSKIMHGLSPAPWRKQVRACFKNQYTVAENSHERKLSRIEDFCGKTFADWLLVSPKDATHPNLTEKTHRIRERFLPRKFPLYGICAWTNTRVGPLGNKNNTD